jgi:hypothetical protein
VSESEMKAPDGSVRRDRRVKASMLTAAGVVVVAVCGVLVYLVSNARHSALETLCHANLFKLRHALLQYESSHGTLPPAFINGRDGRPAHSWRVLILPHLDSWGIDGNTIHKAYDTSESWNGPNNRQLFRPVQESRFACPCGPEDGTTHTSYVVLVGEDTLFPGIQAVALSEIPNTVDPILVLEITNSDIEWPEPRDLQIDQIAGRNAVNSIELIRPHAGFMRYITLSGRLGVLPMGTDIEVVRQLASTSRQPAIEKPP